MKANIQLPVSMSTVGHQGPLIELYVYSGTSRAFD